MMMANDYSGSTFWINAQIGLCGLALLVLVGWPPRSGALMLVPLGTVAATRVVPMALERNALLLGPGPLPGSYVVRGERAGLAAALLTAGIVTLAAPASGCIGLTA